ncbi:MAG: hypothetical protein PVI33_01450 [Candidatus Omnitrophota bacterium]|jgi:hypothetical protein
MMINKKAQNIIEYAIIIGLISSALLTMKIYFQRGIEAVTRERIDDLSGFGSGMWNAQQIQEMGIETNLDETLGPVVPFVSITTFNNRDTVRTRYGGERRTAPNENSVSNRTSRGYQRIKYDQVTQPNVSEHRY